MSIEQDTQRQQRAKKGAILQALREWQRRAIPWPEAMRRCDVTRAVEDMLFKEVEATTDADTLTAIAWRAAGRISGEEPELRRDLAGTTAALERCRQQRDELRDALKTVLATCGAFSSRGATAISEARAALANAKETTP